MLGLSVNSWSVFAFSMAFIYPIIYFTAVIFGTVADINMVFKHDMGIIYLNDDFTRQHCVSE